MAAEGNVDLIVHDTFFRDRTIGVLVEVGAARPDYLSISASSRSRGWRIIAIESNPAFCAAHRALGYDVLEYARSDENADGVPFFVVDSRGHQARARSTAYGLVSYESLSSLGIEGDPLSEATKRGLLERDSTFTTILVQVRTLDTILGQHAPDVGEIDVLAVDVESWELKVMRGIDLAKYRPKVVILENLRDDAGYLSFMRDVGYVYWKHVELYDV